MISSFFITVAGFAFGAFLVVDGMRVWRGHEPAWVRRFSNPHDERSGVGPFGCTRCYQTILGSGHAGVPGGTGMLTILTGYVIRAMAGQPREWWLMYVFGYAGLSLMVLTGVYLFAYFWVGVPDWMRPPAQRGWQLTKQGYELVRPDAVPPHLRPNERRAEQWTEQEPW